MFGIKYVLFISVTSFSIISLVPNKEYGEYQIDVLHYEIDVNNRLKEHFMVNILTKKYDNGSFSIGVYSRVIKDMGILGLKLRVFTWNEKQSKFLPTVNIAMKNLCENQISKEILSQIPGLNGGCQLRPATYNFTIGDLNSFVHVLTNGRFFYGRYLCLSDIHAGKFGRIIRSNVTALIKPIKSD